MPGEYTSRISAILLLILLKLIHQSIPAAPNHPPPAGALAFFCLGWQIPGGGDS